MRKYGTLLRNREKFVEMWRSFVPINITFNKTMTSDVFDENYKVDLGVRLAFS
jgi:hypothetical protein